MISLVETIKPYIIHYGYWAVFFGVFLEYLGLPLPGETLIIVAGLLAAKGMLNFSWVVVFAILATFTGNNISYAIGYFGGRSFVTRYGKYVFLNEKRLQGLENFFKQQGSKVVVMSRFIVGMRQFNGFIAGMARMPAVKFTVFNMIGAVLWVVWWSGLAYYFGKRFDAIFIKYCILTGIIAVVMLIITVCRFSKNTDNDLAPQNQPAL